MVKAGKCPARKCFPGDTLREKSANRVSIGHHPVRLVSGAALRDRAYEPGFSQYSGCGAAQALIYKVAALIRCPRCTQGEENALYDDPFSERVPNRETRLGARLQRNGGNGQVQRGTRESGRAAGA